MTLERVPLPFLQNELTLGCGAEEYFYKGLDGTCGGEIGEGAGMKIWEGEMRCGLHLLRWSRVWYSLGLNCVQMWFGTSRKGDAGGWSCSSYPLGHLRPSSVSG